MVTRGSGEGGKGQLFNGYRVSFVRWISQGSPERGGNGKEERGEREREIY